MVFKLLKKLRFWGFKHFQGKGIGKKFPFLWRIYDWVYSFQEPFIHEMEGSKFIINPKDQSYLMRRIGQDYASAETYEPATTEIFKQHIKPGDVVLDIGASIGYFSMLAAKLGAKVYAFEPTKINFNYLCQNIILNNYHNVFPVESAAWSEEAILKVPLNASPVNTCWATGLNLSDYLARLGVHKIDFIKIDTDGSEPWVLKGLLNIIVSNPQLKMVCEYYPKIIEMAGGDPDEVKEILTNNFDCFPIEGDYGDGYWNYFCIRK